MSVDVRPILALGIGQEMMRLAFLQRRRGGTAQMTLQAAKLTGALTDPAESRGCNELSDASGLVQQYWPKIAFAKQ